MDVDRELVAAALPAYDIGAELGRGAFGVVLAGEHRQLRRPVAIKQLASDVGADREVQARFLAEARALASFNHPHIVHIYDYVEHDGLCLLIMDQLTGGTVRSRSRSPGFTPQAACALTIDACAGLQYAHDRGVLHRDIKPDNLMFDADGVLKVVDFGIAKVVGGSSLIATRSGMSLGTPAYMAPEQARTDDLTPATDVYATATLLYELLSKQLPYDAVSDPMAAMFQHVYDDPRPLRDADPTIPAPLAAVVDAALARDPSARPQSAAAFARALGEAASDAWGTPRPPASAAATAIAPAPARDRRPALVGAGAVAVLAVVVAVVLILRGGGSSSPGAAPPRTPAVASTGTSPVASTGPAGVVAAMFHALNAGDDQTASTFFAAPTTIRGTALPTPADVRGYLATSLCGATIERRQTAGDTVDLTVRLFARPGHAAACTSQYIGTETPVTIVVQNGKIASFS